MKNRFLTICLIVVLAVTSLGLTTASHTPAAADLVKSIQSLGIFRDSKWTVHYRAPNIDQVETYLEAHGIPLTGPEAAAQAVQVFMSEWAKRNPTTPDPEKLQELLDRERQGLPGPMAATTATGAAAVVPQIMSLAVPVEFPKSDTFTWCGAPVTTTGPLHNQIPAPGPRDNNTIWYNDTTPALYNELYFGVGPDAGVIVHHPNLGDVDLRGNTMANFYLEQSYGTFTPMGAIYPKWLQAAHSEGWYGADSEAWDATHTTCTAGGNHNVLAPDLVREVVDAIKVDNPGFAWQTYDGDADGIVDNFTVIHAGTGQESGGGLQGDFSIWSHASAIDYPTGKLACTKGSAGCPDRNIYVRSYSMDPENIDVGVISEEFGHAAFGLPDIYTTDAQGSPSNWAIMEAGSWNGPLGGMQPAPFPLVFRYLVGWATPLELSYDTTPTIATVEELSKSLDDEHDRDLNQWYHRHVEQGIKVNLPDTVINVVNRAGTGNAWWSDRSDLADFYLAHDFDLTTATTPVFSFDSYWSFEQDYDYGYLEVSTDAGLTWTKLPDVGGIFVDDGMGNLGLNGEDSGNLSFNLAAYAGKTISLRLHYTSDVGVQWAGWWADNFLLMDGATTLFTDLVDNPPNGWTTNHFVIVPLTRTYPVYYMAEWRNSSGFDKGLAYPYTTIYNSDATTEWEVDRCPYTVPGMLLWLRNGAQDFDYTLMDSITDPPSVGPKHALLVVDSHYWPLEWEGMGSSGVNLRLNSRCQPGNATFTVQKTTPFTARRGEVVGGVYTGNILETKTFDPLPAVSQFHDSLGYYPGFRYHIPGPTEPADNEGLWYWDAVASLVVPAKGNYTTNLTWDDKTPATDLYGIDIGPTVLGTGNPRDVGDTGVQYGLNIAVLSKSKDGSTGRIAVWNATTLVGLKMRVFDDHVYAGEHLAYMLRVQNLGPATQPFSVSNPIPANTTFAWGRFYNADTNSIEWTGKVRPHETKVLVFWVTVNEATPVGTEIVNNATLTDDALGSSASVTSTIVEHHPHHH